jgi:hypothetical protein
MAVNTQKITVRPTLRTDKNTDVKALIKELELYTRELENKLKLLDKAVLELQDHVSNSQTT